MAGKPLDCLRFLNKDAARRLAQRHLDELQALDADAARVVDKMPENALYLGLIATLFPRAKLIHCRRDDRDVALSCWMTSFGQLRWASDPDHIASRIKAHRRVMTHWRRVLPVPILEIEYEALVGNLETTARELVAFCGLEWDSSCLEFHKSPRPVRTPSVAQVRQPLYQSSVGRWKHYERPLGVLFAKLSGDT